MKKFLVFAALLFVMSAAVFAQELKFDGYLNSGLGVVSNDKDGDDPYFKAFGVDSESNGFRFRLNGSYTNEAKNAGVKFRLQSQRTISATGYLSIPYLYGWLNFFDNKLTLTGGLVDDGTWTSADWWINDDTGEGLGLLLKGEPIKGLNLGVGAYTISQQSGGNNNALLVEKDGDSKTKTLPNFGDIMLKPDSLKYTFNAAYTMPDTFRLGLIYRTQNKAGWTADRALDIDKYGYGGQEESAMMQVELRLLMVKNLTAVIVGKFDKLQKNDATSFDKNGNITFSETFGYKMDSLNFGLNAVQFMYNRQENDKKVEYSPGLLFNPWVTYTLDKIVPRLDLVYFLGGQSKTASGSQWERKGFATVARAKEAEDDYSVFSLRPSVKINLDGKTFLEIGDMINIDMASKNKKGEYPYADSKNTEKTSLFTNVFYTDVKFSF